MSGASHEKFIHHESLCAKNADESHERGWFNIIEDEYGIYVFDCFNGMIAGNGTRYETVIAAITEAQRLADAYDDDFVAKMRTPKKFLGFQLADRNGNNIQGDDADPTGLASFEIMTPTVAGRVVEVFHGFLLMPIYEGDIEEPKIVATLNPNPRYVIDGHEFLDGDGDMVGDGEFPPFEIFDTEAQNYVAPPYPTRQEAETALAALNASLKRTRNARSIATWPPATEARAKEAATESGKADLRGRYDSWTSLCRDHEIDF